MTQGRASREKPKWMPSSKPNSYKLVKLGGNGQNPGCLHKAYPPPPPPQFQRAIHTLRSSFQTVSSRSFRVALLSHPTSHMASSNNTCRRVSGRSLPQTHYLAAWWSGVAGSARSTLCRHACTARRLTAYTHRGVGEAVANRLPMLWVRSYPQHADRATLLVVPRRVHHHHIA